MLAHSCYTIEDALLFGVLMVKRQMCMYVTHGKDHVFLIDTMRTPYSLVHLRTTGSTRGREFCTIISMVEYSRYLWCKRTPILFPASHFHDRNIRTGKGIRFHPCFHGIGPDCYLTSPWYGLPELFIFEKGSVSFLPFFLPFLTYVSAL